MLDNHSVRYKQLPANYLPQAPSARLTLGAFVFPGSKSEYNHILYLAEVQRNLLTVAYSKNTIYASAEKEVQETALLKLMDANSAESLAIWKLEERQGSLSPVLEMALFPSAKLPEAKLKDLIWRNCGTLDSLYKAGVAAISPLLVLDTPEISKKVKDFLVSIGFRKIKESSIPNGFSFLVVMSSDEEPEESKWKRFPLKIDVTGILAFRIYFSLEDSAVTAKGHFSNSVKYLIAKINPKFNIGYYNYATGSNQIQFTIKLHYKTLTSADISASLKAYYDTCVLYYQWTVPALAAMYGDMLEVQHSKKESEISEYNNRINEEIQEKTSWESIGIQKNRQGQGTIDTELLELLSENEVLAKYLLEKPIFQLKPREEGKISVLIRTSIDLLPIKTYITTPNKDLEWTTREFAVFLNTLLPFHIFPTLSMIYCQLTPVLRLCIVPNADLHSESLRFTREMTEFLQIMLTDKCTMSDINQRILNSDYFDTTIKTCIAGIIIAKSRLGGDECLLYRIDGLPRTRRFMWSLQLYTSLMESLDLKKNPILGWTELSFLDEADEADESVYYLCERCNYRLWREDALISVLIQATLLVKTLHKGCFCHWFVNPMTIRQAGKGILPGVSRQSTAEDTDVTVVLPCIIPSLSGFIFSVIPKPYHRFIAPEVKRYITEDILVEDIFAADVYSLSQVIYEKLRNSLETRVELRTLRELLMRGRAEDPKLRPGLREVLAGIKAL